MLKPRGSCQHSNVALQVGAKVRLLSFDLVQKVKVSEIQEIGLAEQSGK